MATKVYMEALSPTMEEGRLVTWLKADGEAVKEGDVLAEVETDKATMELVARGTGVLRRVLPEGETAAVGTVIAAIASEGEDVSSLTGGGAAAAPAAKPAQAAGDAAQASAAVAATGPTEQHRATEATPATAPQAAAAPAPEANGAGDGRVKASPLARRLAAEAGVQLGGMQGSGPGGRVVKRDVEDAVKAAASAPAPSAPAAEAPAPAPAAAAPAAPSADSHDVPLSQMRKTIAKRLTQSIGPIPHFFLTVEVDMGEAAALRARVNERFASEGVKVSPNDLVIRAAAAALRKHPWVNASWTGDAIRFHDRVHIGVAVAVEEGLITPVIRDADRKGVTEIAKEVRELAGRAREKKLKPEEYTGGTFSISNLGMFGIEEFTAVINPPEAAILAIGAVEPKVVALPNGEMGIRQRMRVTMSCDHRVIDGATGAAFLQTFKRNLEDPMMMLA